MAAGDTPITVVGNLVADPELRFTSSGQPVATFRVASTPRVRDAASGEWKDGDSLFLTCNVWRQAAENVAESLQRGMRVIVSGRLRQRSYETKEGEKRTVYEVEVDDGVDAFRLLVDRVGEPTLPPDVKLADLAAIGGHDLEEPLKRRLDRSLLEVRVEDDHDFVVAHARPVPPLD